MTVLALIPARGGSTGILRKNLALLAGRPLVEWTIDAGLGAERVERVVVSSDDPEILAVSSRCGAETMMRPSRLATGSTRSEPVLGHALEALGVDDGVAVLLQPTSPLRTSLDVDEALARFDDESVQAVIAVSEPEKSPFKALCQGEDGFLKSVSYDADAPFRPRQSLPDAWFPNGAIYAVRTRVFLELQTFLPPRTAPFVMPTERSFDVDTAQDLERIERVWRDQQPAIAV